MLSGLLPRGALITVCFHCCGGANDDEQTSASKTGRESWGDEDSLVVDAACHLQLLAATPTSTYQQESAAEGLDAIRASSMNPYDRSQLHAVEDATDKVATAAAQMDKVMSGPLASAAASRPLHPRQQDSNPLLSTIEEISVFAADDANLRAEEGVLLGQILQHRDQLRMQQAQGSTASTQSESSSAANTSKVMSTVQHNVQVQQRRSALSRASHGAKRRITLKMVASGLAGAVLLVSIFLWFSSSVRGSTTSVANRPDGAKSAAQESWLTLSGFCAVAFPVVVVFVCGILWLAWTGALNQMLAELQLLIFVVGTAIFALGVFINQGIGFVRTRLTEMGDKFHEFDQRTKVLQKQMQDTLKLKSPMDLLHKKHEDEGLHDVHHDPLLLGKMWDVAKDPFGTTAHPPGETSARDTDVLLQKLAAAMYMSFNSLEDAYAKLSGGAGVLTHNEFVSQVAPYLDRVEGLPVQVDDIFTTLSSSASGYVAAADFDKCLRGPFDACGDAIAKLDRAKDLGKASALQDAISRAKRLYLNRCSNVLDAQKSLLDARKSGSAASLFEKPRGQVKLRSDAFLVGSEKA